MLVLVHLSNLFDRASCAYSLEKAEVEFEHYDRELYYRIASRSERITGGGDAY